MDPNEALRNLRTAAKLVDAHNNGIYVREDDLANACNDMAEAFLALDEWLTKGGFKPSAWETTVVLNAERQFAERDFDRHADEAVALGNGGTLPTG